MANIVSKLAVALGLEASEFNEGLSKAKGEMTTAMATGTALGEVAVKIGEHFLESAKQAIEFADQMASIARANDMAVASVLEFTQSLSMAGGRTDDMNKLMSSFTNKLDSAAQGTKKAQDNFKELGVSMSDLKNLSEEDLLKKTVAGLASIEDPIHRNAMAFEVFGKAIKGVDIKELNQNLQELNGTSKASDEAFGKMKEAMDKLDALSFEIKTDLVNNLASPFYTAISAMTDFYHKWKEEHQKALEANNAAFKRLQEQSGKQPAWLTALDKSISTQEALQKRWEQDTSHWVNLDTTLAPNMGATNIDKLPKRDVKQDQELTKEIQKQADALNQQLLTLQRQSKEYTTQKSLYEQINAEFERGGKYDKLKDEHLKNQLLGEAKWLDMAKAFDDYDKRREAYMLQMYETGQQIVKQAEERADKQRESVSLQIQELENLTKRREYEAQLIGLSDTQKTKALAYYDLKQKIIELGQDPLFKPDQIDAIEKANQALIEMNDTAKRMENTFQAGFNSAFANFKEKALDSFSAGQDAFNTMSNSMSAALDNFVSTGKLSFSSLAASIIADLIKIQMRMQMTSLFGSLNLGGLFGGTGGGISATAGAYSIDANPFIGMYADGGSPPVGVPSIVGERGPELFIPKTAGTIIPNNQLSNMMGSQPQVVYNGTVVQNMNAIDTQSAIQFLSKNKTAVFAANMSAQRGMPMTR